MQTLATIARRDRVVRQEIPLRHDRVGRNERVRFDRIVGMPKKLVYFGIARRIATEVLHAMLFLLHSSLRQAPIAQPFILLNRLAVLVYFGAMCLLALGLFLVQQ